MSPEEFAKLEEAYKHSLEKIRTQTAALRAKIGRPTVRMRNGGDPKKVIWPTEDEYCARAKETLSPEELEQMKARYREMREQAEKGTKDAEVEIISTDSEGRVTSAIMLTHELRQVYPADWFTDPWTGKPRVFTEEEKAKYGIAGGGWPLERRERVASFECKICNRLFREHSTQEFNDCMAQIEAPTVRLFPKGKTRAKKETVAHRKCEICSRQFGDHSQQEYDACINQRLKRNKPRQEDLVYVKCEICGLKFGDHSPEKFDACIDQMIENRV